MSLQALEDLEAIRHLKAYYGKYADAKYTDDHRRRPQQEIDELAKKQASVFTEDALWDGGPFGVLHGRQAIYESLRLGPWTFSVHYYLSPLIDLAGDSAHARWMLWQTGTLTKNNTPVLLSAITEDDYVRTPQGWKISRMVQTLKFMTRFDVPWTTNRNAPLAF